MMETPPSMLYGNGDEGARVKCYSEANHQSGKCVPHVEVCGLLFGQENLITEARACRNVALEPAHSFEVDPAVLIAAYRAMRAGGAKLIGCYHSHPKGLARPSAQDADAAQANGWLWLIVAGKTMTCWRAQEGGTVEGRFEPLQLEVAPTPRVGQKEP